MTTSHDRPAWPPRTHHRNEKKLIQVVYQVPALLDWVHEVSEPKTAGLVTEIYDYGDPQHRDMIERAKTQLGYEVISVTNYDGRLPSR